MSQEKTEKPTRRRLQEVRRRGQSPRSVEASQAAALLAIVFVLPTGVHRLREAITQNFYGAIDVASNPDEAAMGALLRRSAIDTFTALLPAVATVALVSVVVQLAVVGGRPNMQQLRPRFERINPALGAKRLFSKQLAWEFARSTLKLGAVAVVLAATWSELHDRLYEGVLSIPDFLGVLSSGIDTMVGRAAALALLVAIVDVVVSRRRYMKSARMTKQEVRDEMRHSEGDPHVKGEVKRRMLKMSRLRMMADVAKATVVLTNPTHFAVALRYDENDPAPIVVAKGADEVAQRIKAEAKAHNVPCVENKPLTRALFKATDIGDQIPADFYQAVAEVFAVLWRSGRAA